MNYIRLFFVSAIFLCSTAHAGEIQFETATYSEFENVTPVVITVTRTGDTSGAATVLISSADIGTSAGLDYTAISTTLSWAADDAASKTVNLTLINDVLVEGAETLRLTLSGVTGDTLGANSVAIVTIEDYEAGKLALSSATYSVSEAIGTATITVLRTEGSGGAVQVNYATSNGTATTPDSYTATSGTLTFADGISSQTISIPIIDNAIGAVDKVFNITLTLPSGGASLGAITTAAVTIVNDESDYTGGLTRISPSVTNITQPSIISMSQASPLSTTTLLASVNQLPVLEITELEAAQATTTGIMTINIGTTTAHFFPYRVIRLDSFPDPEIILDQDFSGRFITEEGLQIEFEPALASIATLQTQLTTLGIPRLIITQYGNITVKIDQGAPPLEVDSNGAVYINNSFYDRFNLRPGLTSIPVDPAANATAGVYLINHSTIEGLIYIVVIYANGSELRQQVLSTAPAITDEYIAGLQALGGVSNVILGDYGTSTFVFGGQTHGMYADAVVRRVDPRVYGSSPATGLFGTSDINGDGTADYRMVYSNGDEQYFFYYNPR